MKNRVMLMVLLLLGIGMVWRVYTGLDSQSESMITTKKVRIALNGWPGYAHAFVAEKKGLFTKHGVAVELKFYQNIVDALSAFKYGEVDGVFGVLSDAIMLHVEGVSVKVVLIVDYSQSGDVIIGRPDINSLDELKGKTVSFESLNSFSQIFVLKVLSSQGLNEINVHFELVAAQDVLKALDDRRIDAGHTWQPTSSQALAKGYKILAKAGDFPGIITDVLFFNGQTITERSKDVQGVVRALLEARVYSEQHKSEALAIMAMGAGMSVEELSAGLNELSLTNLQENVTGFSLSDSPDSLHSSSAFITRFLLKRGVLQVIPKIEDLLDGRFVTTIDSESKP